MTITHYDERAMADYLRSQRTLSQAEVDRRGAIHDLDDFTAAERRTVDVQTAQLVAC